MEATRPLLGADADEPRPTPYYYQLHTALANGHGDGHGHGDELGARRRGGSLLLLDDAAARDDGCCARCSRAICCLSAGYARVPSPTSGYKELPNRESLLSNGTASSTDNSSYGGNGFFHQQLHAGAKAKQVTASSCMDWTCWKWIFPDRVNDYDDFASSEEMGEIFFIRQKTREFFDATNAEDEEMVHHLWNALFPMLPYDGRVNPRWRDIGFQNDDPASDFRSSGRFGLKMLLYFADHMNEEFKRLVRENRFPVCLCALNVIEMLLIHLNLKDPLPLVCPCCGTDNAERETSNPSRDRPELKGFISILTDCSWSASRSNQLSYTSEWPIEIAFGQIFMHTMVVLDGVWKQQLQQDPTMTLMHFREALYATCQKVLAFLSRRNSPVDLAELAAWSAQYKHAKKSRNPKPSKKCI